MQNKGAVKLFAIALALVCLYQLSFTWFSNRVEKRASLYAESRTSGIEDPVMREARVKEIENYYLDSMSSETVYNFFWIRKYTYADCKEREINLGLDLRGGMNVTLEVSVDDVLMSLSNHSTDPDFLKAMDVAKKMPPSEPFVSRFAKAYKEIAPNGRLSSIFSTVELRDRIPFNATNDEVLKVLRDEAEGAVSNTYTIIRNRIDRFGVAQPNVQRLEQTGRILVELPGVKEPERVRKLLQGTASLEFWETYDNAEVYQYLAEANSKIRDFRREDVSSVPGTTSSAEASEASSVRDAVAQQQPRVDALNEDSVRASSANELTTALDHAGDSVSSLVEELSKKSGTDSLLANREAYEREFPLFAVLSPSATQDDQLFPGPVVGLAHYRDTAAINAMLKDPRVRVVFPHSLRLLWTVKPASYDKSQSIFQLVAIKVSSRDGKPKLDGGAIAGARTEMSQMTGESEVSMWMNAEGAKTWARMTADNLGHSIAIVLDGYVYSFPVVQSEIKGGRSSITGGFTIKEAKDLVNVLQSGKLPAPARIIQEEVVGPSLGQKAIDQGVRSFIMSLIVILLFMVFYYSHIAGGMADFALLANLFYIMGILASFQATLTLPGIAGIVLTLGMAVDANVLIFERIKEERAKGKGLSAAIDDGFKNALSAIIDGNVTTLLTAVVLYLFGSGPIKGFATTLAIGILTSMFTAIFITRLLMLWFLKKGWKLSFDISLTKDLFSGVNFDFIGKRKAAYILSSALIAIVICSLAIRGFDQGIDFVGGRTYDVKFTEPIPTETVAEALEKVYGQRPQVKIYGESNQLKITTKYKIEDNGTEVDDEVETLLYDGLKPLLPADVTKEKFLTDYKQSSIKVGPTIALDIRRDAVISVVLALAMIFLYILIRFKNWRYSAGAVISLAHDAMLVIGCYTLLWGIVPFNMEIDQAFIAAVLTIIGYSINDTVVVFDRIREYRGLYPTRNVKDTFNSSLNSVLSRTFVTSLSTLVVLVPMVFFGGDSIRGFVMSLSIGIIVGTYSSMFIATPLAYDFGRKQLEAKKDGEGVAKKA